MLKNSENAKIDSKSFDAISKLAYRESGLQLVVEKSSMIQSRLRHRLKASGMNCFQEYADFVCSDRGFSERRHMISALTTNVSHFFREQHHFEILAKQILPRAINSAQKGNRIRIWSAGCSNGQEAYSIAMTILENYPEALNLDIKILATDIDPKVVLFGENGEYPERLISGVPAQLLKKYFVTDNSNSERLYVAKPDLKSLVYFKELNLLSNWPMKHLVDVIFCRNVVIYFDFETQNRLWPRFRQQLSENGQLFLGHSERITDPGVFGFISDGPTAYKPIERLSV